MLFKQVKQQKHLILFVKETLDYQILIIKKIKIKHLLQLL